MYENKEELFNELLKKPQHGADSACPIDMCDNCDKEDNK